MFDRIVRSDHMCNRTPLSNVIATRMKHMRKQLFIILFSIAFVSIKAQQSNPKLATPPLQTFWGNSKGGNLPLEFTLNIIDSAIWVIDEKKQRYAVSRFILLYKSKDKYEDEQTGDIKTRFNNNSIVVRNAAVIDEKWRKLIYENIKPGDELIITDIIVRDKRNHLFKAPDFSIVVN